MIALRHRRFARLGAAVAATAVLGLLAAAVVTADTGSLNTLKVIGAPTYSPPVSSGSFSVTVAVNVTVWPKTEGSAELTSAVVETT